MLSEIHPMNHARGITKPKILIVDDIDANHRAFNHILNELDADIVNAYSGEEALSLGIRHHFAVILLDVMMPEMDGYETASLLRINDDTKYTPIIFVTALDRDDESENLGYNAGAVDFLFKPVKPHLLTSKVNVFLQIEEQRQRIRDTLEDIQELEKRNDLLLKSVGEGILGLDQTGRITFSNPAASKILGYSKNEFESVSFDDISCNATTEKAKTLWEDSEIYQCCNRGMSYQENLGVFWRKKHKPFPVEYFATPIKESPNESFSGVVIAFQDITERRKVENQLAELAQIDTLTGLYNRYAFTKQLAQSLSRAKRQQSGLALLFIDLDNFKQVNDNLGHEVGDQLLHECAMRLMKSIREGDILSRIGGDEFTIIIESLDLGTNAAVIAKNIIDRLSKPFIIHRSEIVIGASIGIANFPDSSDQVDELLRCADIAMYKAKSSGKNSYQFFTDAMQTEVSRDLHLEKSLRKTVNNQSFAVYYQPKIRAVDGSVAGSEALIRWQKPDGNFVSPEKFIAKAETIGLIETIDSWVMQQSCQQMRAWIDAGIFQETDTVAVNLSIRQLVNTDILTTINECLSLEGLPACNLELEITESMLMQEPEFVIDILQQIHALGVRISLDDFGTGYSSLSHLIRLPVDCLKIDKSFIQSLGQEKSDAIVKTIISLGKNLHLDIVAEGVETEAQLSFLKNNRVDLIQGFYYNKAIPADDFTEYVKLLNFTHASQ